MKKFFLAAISLSIALAQTPDATRWAAQAKNIEIIRDDWGIAHVFGHTDADAVFGMIYAQAEDDFNRVETNYLNSMGRLAESEGESKIYQDLRMKLFIDPANLRKQFTACPPWLQKLMVAWADGLNFYLSKHPETQTACDHAFRTVDGAQLHRRQHRRRYRKGESQSASIPDIHSKTPAAAPGAANQEQDEFDVEPRGSNGAAVAPSNTLNHHALLLINPHTSFFFRSELEMVSDEGLHAYGAATWGQFFLYQGFNPKIGWMHTSSGVDAIDEYLESIVKKGDRYFYKYGSEERPVTQSEITVPYKTDHGMAEKKFTVYRTHHGPIIREQNGKWVAIRLMEEPIKALTQSYTRTKAHDYKSFRETMELKADSSNNTIFADADGDIAYFHGNFIPRRDTKFDWKQPVDGSNPETDWKGLLNIDETPHLPQSRKRMALQLEQLALVGIRSQWRSPKREDYPAYVENGGESARGLHAVRVLENKRDFTVDSLIAAAYDSYLTWFDKPLARTLIKAWDSTPESNPLKAKTAEQIKLLRAWDQRWAVNSIPTSLAVFWGDEVRRRVSTGGRRGGGGGRGGSVEDNIVSAPADQLLESLVAASDKLAADFGSWKTPWGDINRFQRLNDDINPTFTDSGASIPVAFTSANWGSLASFGARAYPGTKKWYGTSGNSFVAVVEFGDKVRARAVTAGGESGNPSSKHFNDEAQRYATGNLRDVYFYREQLKGHTERTYHPGN